VISRIVFTLWSLINESAALVHISHKRMRYMPAWSWPLVEGKDQQNRKRGPGAIKTVQAGDWHDFINGDSSPAAVKTCGRSGGCRGIERTPGILVASWEQGRFCPRYLWHLNNGSNFLKSWRRNQLPLVHLTVSECGRNGRDDSSTPGR
jgi:hypothetical protein